jgi:serine/threonine protein kinase
MIGRLQIGTVLRERYKITDVVGRGGMGNVYRAEDLRLPGRLCAIKEVQPEANASPETRLQEQSQFLREASLLAQLDHPNLPKVSDFFTDGGRDYLVMDFVPGKNLKEMINESQVQGQKLDVKTVMEWAIQIMDAMEYLHNQDPPVLHRDIKPANIKLTPDSRIKLVDFGLAKLMTGDSSSTVTVIQGRGTAYYTPLEQYGAESEHTDVRSDIYAFGGTLYHLLTAQAPPEAKERFLNPAVLRPIHTINKDVSRDLSDSIQWALEMHPQDRPENVATLRRFLLGEERRPPRSDGGKGGESLSEAIKINSMILLIAIGLFLLAVMLTIM